MYEEYYGFKEKPFSMLPDPGFLYLSKKHRIALTLLEYGLLNHVGFCVISGEPGAGKTTILRALLERIGDDITVGLITNTHQSFGGLLDWILSSFNLHQPNLTHVEMHQIFMAYLIAEYAKGHTVLLIVDEAQNMKPDVLEELRMLSNVNSAKDQLMQVVLAGQPALRETLRSPDLMQFAQRIAVDYHLESLNLKETCGYIQHRLVTAGSQRDIFTPAACERIHNFSGGTPRLINLLCETALVYGFADQKDMIDVELVDEIVLEHMKDSVVPIVNRDIATQYNTEVSKALEKDFPWIRPKGNTVEQVPVEAIKPDNVESKKKQEIIEENIKPLAQTDQGKSNPGEKARQKAEKPVAAKVNSAVSSKKNHSKTEPVESDKTHKQLIKYGLISVATAVILILIVFSRTLGDDDKLVETEVAIDEAQSLLLQREMDKRKQEEKQLRQLQIQTAILKQERDAAIVKVEEERQAKQYAEKQAAAQAAVAEKAALESRRMAEKKQIKAAKQRENEAKIAEAKIREEADRAKRETARLAEEMRKMQARLEEEQRLNETEATRRLELEKQEKKRQQVQASEAVAEAAAATTSEKERSIECTGPSARYKAACR